MITLLPFETSDYTQLIAWVGSERLLFQFAGQRFQFPLTCHQLAAHLQDPNRYVFKVFCKERNRVVGHAEISDCGSGKGVICRMLIGEENLRNLGYGRMTLQALIEFARKQLHMDQLFLNVYHWNKAAISCYQQVGFQIIPFKKRYILFNEERWEVLRMQYIG
ncbi:GNAT family N-acetyltransferase [Sphingobacterium lactis]|nr:GNAT family protein [Sphingobacterium lactis]